MKLNQHYLSELSRAQRYFVGSFVIVLTIGYFSGLLFVGSTTNGNAQGISEQYIGNEADESADIMKFKKSDQDMYRIIHSHILSFSMIFFLIGILFHGTRLSDRWKTFFSVEPFVSTVLTFGSLLLVWRGFFVFTYVAMLSGFLMTGSFVVMAAVVLYDVCASTGK